MEDCRLVGSKVAKNADTLVEAKASEEVTLKSIIIGDTWYKTVLNVVMFLVGMFYILELSPIVEWRTGKFKAFMQVLYLSFYAYVLFILFTN